MVSYLEDETNVSKVASFIQGEEYLLVLSPVCLDAASVDEEEASAHCILSHNSLSLFELLVRYRGRDVGNQLVISSKTKFLVIENDIKLGLEGL